MTLTTSPYARLTAVVQARANFAMEGFAPDDQDTRLQAGYVAGTVTIDDMLAHAREYAQQFKNKSNFVSAMKTARVCDLPVI